MSRLRYADRLPIGLEKVIKGVTAETVKAFFHKWYRPENMAVIVVGDMGGAPGMGVYGFADGFADGGG